MVGFCDLLGTLYAPVSKIPSVNTYSSVVESDNEIGNFSYLDMECPRRTWPMYLLDSDSTQSCFLFHR